MKCVGNCAICEVAAESKAACCAIQTLKNSIESKAMLVEIKAMIIEMRDKRDPFEGVPDVNEGISESEPTALGAENNDKESQII